MNEANKVRPGQYAGRLGLKYEAWHVDLAAPCALGNGACPNCFRFDDDHYEHASATIFDALGIPHDTHWTDFDDRPHKLYRAEPIAGLF